MPDAPVGADDLRTLVERATDRLAAAEVPSPAVDAVVLAAHVLGVDPGEVRRRMVLREGADAPFVTRYEAVISERADRVPLQHLTGRAPFRRLELHVGPGVFVPRPETESVAQHAIDLLIGAVEPVVEPVVVDLGTGSGALALAIADEVPGARVTALEVSPDAVAWARRNLEVTGLDVAVVEGDATSDPAATPALAELVGRVDLVVSNPPYIPLGMEPVDPEVREHDPQVALYGGSEDGLALPRAIAATAARLLRPGGHLVMEHADSQGESLPAALRAAGWLDVRDESDLTGRPRTTIAVRP